MSATWLAGMRAAMRAERAAGVAADRRAVVVACGCVVVVPADLAPGDEWCSACFGPRYFCPACGAQGLAVAGPRCTVCASVL